MPKQQAKQEALPFTVHKLETVAKDDHTLFDTQNSSLADPLLRPTRLSLFLADDLGGGTAVHSLQLGKEKFLRAMSFCQHGKL